MSSILGIEPDSASGEIDAVDDTVTILVRGYGSVGIQLSGTWAGTITFQGSVDGSNWQALDVWPTNSATSVTTATANGVWYAPVGGLAHVRANFTTFTSGTATVTLRVTTGSSKVLTPGITSVIPGTGATNLGKAEDAAHTSGDVGVMALGVRQNAPAALGGTDGDYVPPIFDALGRMWTMANMSATAILPSSVSSSYAGTSDLGVTVVAPESGRNTKVYAYSLTTTGVVSTNVRFTNGAGNSPTEFWRVALQAPSSTSTGANFGVQPPAYLFATGSNTTLTILTGNATLIHYSVSYFKESA